MSDLTNDLVLYEFQQALRDCRDLYHSCARLCVEQYPGSLTTSSDSFSRLMDDLHKGLLIKIYVAVVEADHKWSTAEKKLGRVLFEHVWPGGVPGGQLREAAEHVFREADQLKWQALLRPFTQIAPLRDRVADVQTLVLRIANLIAKADGSLSSAESASLEALQREVDRQLLLTRDEPDAPRKSKSPPRQAVQMMKQEAEQLREKYELAAETPPTETSQSQEEKLAEAFRRLDELVGMSQVKHEVRTLTNYLKLQQQRLQQGLPTTSLSLHMVFGGNPGTGKTTVARIVGQIYGAMGILRKGHLVEADRSGLVAEYAGQTAPKTNKIIDESLDGVLFIDEAYSLVAESGDDPYGREAVQALLKRMEDNRDRLVVILAGYTEEMERLLRSNPGLSSRFNTKLNFVDYTPGELGQIFGRMCLANHYVTPAATQERLLWEFLAAYQNRDEHFGNGRLVRNTFENAIRRLANRIAGQTPLTRDLLTTIEVADVAVESVPSDFFAQAAQRQDARFQVRCGGCHEEALVPAAYLARRVRCKRCGHRFTADWGEPILGPAAEPEGAAGE